MPAWESDLEYFADGKYSDYDSYDDHSDQDTNRSLFHSTHDGCIVMNSVTPQSHQMFLEAAKELNLKIESSLHIALNEYNPIDILKAVILYMMKLEIRKGDK